MIKQNEVKISYIKPSSIAEQLNIQEGDILLEINNRPLKDILDYYLYEQEEYLVLKIKKENNEVWEYEIEKDMGESLGLNFHEECFDGMLRCSNNCIFCFIKGLPKGLRKSLYIKDDDYRHSFLYGNYITLTNINWMELQRIVNLKLSPLYISIHTTDPDLRREMMNNKNAGDIFDKLKFLSENDISMHTQAVLCPQINDGVILDKTIKDLVNLWPNIISLAVVPVGLTRYNLKTDKRVRAYTPIESLKVIEQVQKWQDKLLKELGTRFIFASDEFYLLANKDLPGDEEYEDYPQLENGVGLVRCFINDFNNTFSKSKNGSYGSEAKDCIIVTGEIFYPILKKLFNKFKIKSRIFPIVNNFFGRSVTVTGLLTGKDLIEGLKNKIENNKVILIPDIMLKDNENKFLDDLTIFDVEKEINCKLKVLSSDGASLANELNGGEI